MTSLKCKERTDRGNPPERNSYQSLQQMLFSSQSGLHLVCNESRRKTVCNVLSIPLWLVRTKHTSGMFWCFWGWWAKELHFPEQMSLHKSTTQITELPLQSLWGWHWQSVKMLLYFCTEQGNSLNHRNSEWLQTSIRFTASNPSLSTRQNSDFCWRNYLPSDNQVLNRSNFSVSSVQSLPS